MDFQDCSGCRDCNLYQEARHPGIPTRLYARCTDRLGKKRTALLIVGEAPGGLEDAGGISWVGWAGKLLGKFIDASGFTRWADVYLSNACRCRPPGNAKPGGREVSACRKYLLMDIDVLAEEYERVGVLCCGAVAAKSLLRNVSIRNGMRNIFNEQGVSLQVGDGADMLQRGNARPVLFFTYHPALLARSPAKVTAVESHFRIVAHWLADDRRYRLGQIVPEVGKNCPSCNLAIAAVDIETYGILKGRTQSVFHPRKSLYVDRVPLGEQIVTVSIAFRDAEGGVRTYLYEWPVPAHRAKVRQWFRKFVRERTIVVGHRIGFDLAYLAAADAEIGYCIRPGAIVIEDTLLLAALCYEEAPEKGLKELSEMYGITLYGIDRTFNGRATGYRDSRLHVYNCRDSAATLVLYELLMEKLRARYERARGQTGGDVADMCRNVRLWALWDTILLERYGCVFDTGRLEELDREARAVKQRCRQEGELLGYRLGSTGSQADRMKLMEAAVDECGLRDDPRLRITPKTKQLSCGQHNIKLVLRYLGDGSLRRALTLLKDYMEADKITGTYTEPMIGDCRRGIVVRNGKAGWVWPVWFPVKGSVSRHTGEDIEQGGTIHGRFTCHHPAIQTFDGRMMACMTSRFAGGMIKCYDMNQIELRMAALLSADPLLMGDFRRGVDIHTRTVKMLFHDFDENAPGAAKSPERQLGKILNFLVLYRGGAAAYQEAAFRSLGVHLPVEFCQMAIDGWNDEHRVFRQWQDELIARVERDGFLVLPTGWIRTFARGEQARGIYEKEICNFPVQTLSAQLVQAAQYQIMKEMIETGMQARVVVQVHDSLIVDMPVGEEKKVDEIMKKHLTNSPVAVYLYRYLGRVLPFDFAASVMAGGS